MPAVPDEDAVAALRAELAAIRRSLDEAERGLPAGRARPVGGAMPLGRHRRALRLRRLRWAAAAGALVLLLAVVALAIPRATGDRVTPPSVIGGTSGTASGGGPGAAGTGVTARLSGAGGLDVEETLALPGPAGTALLTLPDPAQVGGSRLRAPAAAGLQAQSPQGALTVSGSGGRWTVRAADGRPFARLTLRYHLDGAVVGPDTRGRALVLVTPLTAAISRAAGRPVQVRLVGAVVREATCPGAAVAEQLCGSRSEAGWVARIPASSPVPFVVLQVDLPA